MSSNPLLPLQFPTPASLADLHNHLANDALHHLRDHGDAPRILVARVGSDVDSDVDSDSDVGAADADDDDDATGTGNGGRVISFVKWDIVRRRGQGQGRSHVIQTPTAPASASGSRRLEPGNMLPATAAAAAAAQGVVDDGSEEGPPQDQQQHHQQSKAEVGGGTKVCVAEDYNNNNDDESEDEEWPASANREYLTAYATAASKARREAMGSRPFLREQAFQSLHMITRPLCLSVLSFL